MPSTKDANGKPISQRLALRKTQAALIEADDTIGQTRDCIAGQREAYQSVK